MVNNRKRKCGNNVYLHHEHWCESLEETEYCEDKVSLPEEYAADQDVTHNGDINDITLNGNVSIILNEDADDVAS